MNTFSRLATRAILAALRGLNAVRRGFLALVRPTGPFFAKIGGFLGKWLIRPLYRLVMTIRLRINKIGVSTRGFLFSIFTNRYAFHAALLLITAASVYSQIQAKDAIALDAGQRSLLYTLVTDGRDTIVEEQVNPEQTTNGVHYLADAGVIEAVPSVDFDYSDEVADVSVPGSVAVLPENDVLEGHDDVIVTRTKTETYVVKEGDVIGSIAREYGVNVGTILWANKLTVKSLIKPGLTLKIPPVSGVLHLVAKNDTVEKLAKLYAVDADAIRKANVLTEGQLSVGDELMIPGASPAAASASTPVAIRQQGNIKADVPISRIAGKAVDVYQEITGKDDSRPKPADDVDDKSTATLLWPTRLHQINQYYGWKHTGLDIEGDYTDPIYASEDGVVTTAGWNSGGYGMQIIIDHPGGFRTRYAHSSKMFVKVGDKVKRGEVIAMVGTTGRSTGTHLHYEVYLNGVRLNPLKYTK